MGSVRFLIIAAALVLASCSRSPEPPNADPTHEPWYSQTVQRLNELNREAEHSLASGNSDAASAAILRGQPLEKRLLSPVHPTLPATEAASDLDRLYGRMLLANRHYGWARLMFQKNLGRWRTWRPETDESQRRLQQAKEDIAECDRAMQ
jgi:hypothetical protein